MRPVIEFAVNGVFKMKETSPALPQRSGVRPSRKDGRLHLDRAGAAKLRDEWDACHGLKLKFSNPATGDFAMPTIGTFIQLLPKGCKTARYRSTDATVFAAIEGRGRSRIGEQTFEWGPRDLFVVPSWQWVTHEADEDAVLFSFSDRPVQQKLDLFREDRGNA
jgi:gentisate 1,2-dioxygenase